MGKTLKVQNIVKFQSAGADALVTPRVNTDEITCDDAYLDRLPQLNTASISRQSVILNKRRQTSRITRLHLKPTTFEPAVVEIVETGKVKNFVVLNALDRSCVEITRRRKIDCTLRVTQYCGTRCLIYPPPWLV